jgi:hypothetical protein
MHMKNVDLAHAHFDTKTNAAGRVPRGWIVLGAALMSWLVFIGAGTAGTQIFLMIASHL